MSTAIILWRAELLKWPTPSSPKCRQGRERVEEAEAMAIAEREVAVPVQGISEETDEDLVPEP